MARAPLSILAAVTLALALALTNPANAVVIPPLKQPKWADLTPQQRETLTPLSGEWDKLESYRRKKWLGIAQRYPAMSAEEQQRIQRRMKAWANLTPEERKQAREQYKTLQKAPPEQRQAVKQKWQEYKNLPDAEKERLQQSAKRKPQPKSGAGKSVTTAPVPKPVAVIPVPTATITTPPATPTAMPTTSPTPASTSQQ